MLIENSLKDHQAAMYSILVEFDRICKKLDIPYFLFAGSMLGAIRHNGFIPWDDDVDVIMLRKDYERFLNEAGSVLNKEMFFLQKEFSEHFPMFYSKLRLNGTAYLEQYIPNDKKQHQGVFIDIFPCDNAADSKLGKKIQFFSSKVVIANSLSRRGYETNSVKKKLFMLLCRMLNMKLFIKIVKNEKKYDSKMVHSFFASASKYEKNVYPREWFTNSCSFQFERGKFPVSAYYDEVLTTLYGDYMKLPDEKERKCKIHAIKIDLENSYEEYLEWQANQKFDVISRSIR